MQFFILSRRSDRAATFRAFQSMMKLYHSPDIHLIVPAKDWLHFANAWASPNVTVHDERKFSPHIEAEEIRTWRVSEFPRSAGWYYQQFLKLSVAENPISAERFVIWDGDAVPYRRMQLFEDGRPCFSLHRKEYHLPYFETNRRLIGIDRSDTAFGRSAVTRYMPVTKQSMLRLLQRLTMLGSGSWLNAIREAIQERSGVSLFSEYELYFDYMAGIEGQYRIASHRWFRYGGSCTFDQRTFLRLTNHFVAFEASDRRAFSLAGWKSRWTEIVSELKA